MHKTYTIGGSIIFPKRPLGINPARGINKYICDRFDLTLECIRRYYLNEDSPLYSVLIKDKEFFDLFKDFKGYIDYFFLNDLVTKDYKKVNFIIGTGEFEKNPIPKTVEEYINYINGQIEFVKKRNQRIEEYIKNMNKDNKINNKEKYIKDINNRFSGKTKDILLSQVELFYEDNPNIKKTKYEAGEEVKLKKGTFIHGISGELDNFDFTIKNGFISTDFTEKAKINKISNSIGMWNIRENILLKDYINQYSGFTVSYSIGKGPDSKTVSELIPYHKFDEITEKISNDENVWSYWGEQTKEVRFIPSLISNKRQIAFILNMDSDYAKKMAYNDVWNLDFDEETLRPFLYYKYLEKFINEDRINRNASTTDRESAIMFGLPASLIEGIFVGRKIEYDEKSLKYIKEKLPDCYICNLDGKIIIGNK